MAQPLPNLLWVREKIIYFRYPNLFLNPQLVHGVFTRHGGCSEAHYHSLNTSYTVGDAPDNVTANHHTIKETIGANRLIFMNQSHGTDILILRKDQDTLFENIP